MEDEEALEASATVSQLADAVEDLVNDLLANGLFDKIPGSESNAAMTHINNHKRTH